MSENESNGLVYFLITDKSNKKEIGNYIPQSKSNLKLYDQLNKKCKEILNNQEIINQNFKSKKNKIVENDYVYYYSSGKTNVLYIVVVEKSAKIIEEENTIYELIEDVDYQGIFKFKNI